MGCIAVPCWGDTSGTPLLVQWFGNEKEKIGAEAPWDHAHWGDTSGTPLLVQWFGNEKEKIGAEAPWDHAQTSFTTSSGAVGSSLGISKPSSAKLGLSASSRTTSPLFLRLIW